MPRRPVAEFEHLGKFVSRVDMQNLKRNFSEERFLREPDQDVGIFAHRPWHRDVLERAISLAKNENALVLELIEMRALRSGHQLKALLYNQGVQVATHRRKVPNPKHQKPKEFPS